MDRKGRDDVFLEFMGEGHEQVTQREFPIGAGSVRRLKERGWEGSSLAQDVRRRQAILLFPDVLVVLDNGRGLVDDGDLGAQAAEGPAEAGTALGAQRGEVVAEGSLLLVAVARGDEANVSIAVARIAQREDEGVWRIERERRRYRNRARGRRRSCGGCGRARRPGASARGGRRVGRCMLGLLVQLA